MTQQEAPPATPRRPERAAAGGRRGVRALRIAAGVALLAVGVPTGCMLALPEAGLPAPAPPAAAPGQTVTVAAGTRYAAGPLRRFWLGGGRRELWAAPVRVPVLDPAAFAGGLRVLRGGGGNQTRSLHLRGADGREYVFRSLDKDQARGLHPVRRATWGRVRQDQVGALHPAGALVADAVEVAAGLPNAPRRLVVMPDHPALGVHRADFAGMLGTLQENPTAGFAGADAVVSTDSLDAALRRRPGEAVDARAYLTARLVDVFLGDWDRHAGQWRWARVERGGAARWLPVPRDRDYALVDYGGVFPTLTRLLADGKVVRFDDAYRDLDGLLVEARTLDRRFLCALPPGAWDSAALALRGALSDPVLDGAVRRMPAEYVRIDGAALAAVLRARRDRLPDAARRFRAALHEDGGCTQSAP